MLRCALTGLSLSLGLAACGSSAPPPASPAPAPSAAVSSENVPPEPTPEAAPAPAPASASPTAAAPAAPAPAVASTLRWELIAVPARLRMAGRDAFRLRRQVTNTGSEPADAFASLPSYAVDGAPSMALDLAFSNGAVDMRWHALPPGETVSDERDMGMALFPAPGDYEIAMTVDGQTSTVRVHVSR